MAPSLWSVNVSIFIIRYKQNHKIQEFSTQAYSSFWALTRTGALLHRCPPRKARGRAPSSVSPTESFLAQGTPPFEELVQLFMKMEPLPASVSEALEEAWVPSVPRWLPRTTACPSKHHRCSHVSKAHFRVKRKKNVLSFPTTPLAEVSEFLCLSSE